MRICNVILLLFALFAAPAWAHKPSDSYLKITGGGERLTAQWDIAVKDLEFLIGLDEDQNGDVTWGELRRKRREIVALALSRLNLAADGRPTQLDVTDLLVAQHSDGAYAALMLVGDASGTASVIRIGYSLLFDVDPTHRGLVLFDDGTSTTTHILSPAAPELRFEVGETSLIDALLEYIREGMWHIWIGYDHILFLISLLLPAVWFRDDDRWQPVDAFRPTLVSVLKIVTVFTVAHSITLWLAVAELVTLPGWLVESTIAFSIIVTSLNNLFPRLHLSGWIIALAFGLVHGFGFANVLLDLGLSHAALATSLLGFNMGVELGQIAIVAGFLPFAFWLRRTAFYRWVVFRLGSVLIAVVALLWMIERLGNVEILGF